MSLSPGERFGAYEIVSLLGAGGMGEVYRARDSKLGREIALKVLPETLASDPDRIARLEREARALAALNHPRIATLHGVEEHGGRQGLVMELVEGEALTDQLERGALPLEEALRIALQIVDALEAAHEKSLIHRDLKPANVKVNDDGAVKVLDFGLARLGAPEADGAAPNLTHSPTLSMLATQAGVILGTAAYMSPEQAKALPADHRSDIFSFGVVLYEMLTRRQPFQGETAPDIMASVLAREPDLNANVWVYDLSGSSAPRQLTFGGRNGCPIWSPDGTRLAFQSNREGDSALFVQRADGGYRIAVGIVPSGRPTTSSFRTLAAANSRR